MTHLLTRLAAFPSLPGDSARRMRRVALTLLGAVCLLGALALGGCGASTTGVGGGPGNSGGANPGGPRLPVGSPTASEGGPITGTTVRPCVGRDVAPAKTPTIVLTVKNSHQTTQARVGDVIEIELPAKMRWNSPTVPANGTLTPLQPQGGMDEQTQTCRWVYEASAAGTAKLGYTGICRCESNSPCPAIAEDEEFTIQVA